MAVQYAAYQPKKILNTHKHADSWFWDKYSAHPYIGCEHGCEYCYNILGQESERKAGGNLAAGHSEEITD